MIVVVAPYRPIVEDGTPYLGGARKLEMIIGLLRRIDPEIVLVNTAHNSLRSQPLTVRPARIAGRSITEVTLPCFGNRRFGKLVNLIQVRQVVDAVRRIGLPRIVWLYNAYAFECLFARTFKARHECAVILEFEDWHFSRGRGWNPKPYIDYLAWRWSAKSVTHVFAVNSVLASRMSEYSDHTSLLPGIVPARLRDIARDFAPFHKKDGRTVIGYFGGLTREKGADWLLRLVEDLPAGYSIHVSGGGELQNGFMEKARACGERLSFHGKVSDEELYKLIEGCDIIANPHSSIGDMRNGVFPFKVIEAVASGRLLISTPLPESGLEKVLGGVSYCDTSYDGFLRSVLRGREFYGENRQLINDCARRATERFGEQEIRNQIRIIYDATGRGVDSIDGCGNDGLSALGENGCRQNDE